MRVGLFSDVHGNAVALDAALADLRDRVDRLVCLGDHVQGGGQPRECLDRLRELDCPVVLGNADYELLTLDAEDPLLVEAAEWTVEQLSSEQLDFMRGFGPTVEVELADDTRLLCFHGSPRSFDDVVLPETPVDDVRDLVVGHTARIYAGGHVHLQWLRRVEESLWLCAGSVGLAYDRDQRDGAVVLDPWAESAIVSYDDGRLGVEFRRVPFDVDEYVRILRASGHPGAEAAAAEWRTG